MDVVDASGEKIGKIEDVVRSREDGLIYAVVSSGGILGIGAKEIPVTLEKLQVHGDKLRIGTTEEDLRSWPEYQEDQFVELRPSNQPISEFAAFEVTPPLKGPKKFLSRRIWPRNGEYGGNPAATTAPRVQSWRRCQSAGGCDGSSQVPGRRRVPR